MVKWARDHGWYVLKNDARQNVGVPDRLFLRARRSVFIEFKRPGGKLTAHQHAHIERLKGLGFEVYVCDDKDEAKSILSRGVNE